MYSVVTTSNGYRVMSPGGGLVEAYSYNPQINGSKERAKSEADSHANRMNLHWKKRAA